MRYWIPAVMFVLLVVPLAIILPFLLHLERLSVPFILIVVFCVLFLIVRWQWKEYTWKCPKCGHIFERSERSVLIEFLNILYKYHWVT